MAAHPNPQCESKRIAEPLRGFFDIGVDKFGNNCRARNGSVYQHMDCPSTFTTALPNWAPDSRYSCARRHAFSGKTRSTTGLNLPAATSFNTVANSSFVPMYEPRMES